MSKALSISLAAVMLVAASILRCYHNYAATSCAIVAVFAMWFFLVFTLRLKWGEAGMEQWRSIRQKGRTYFVLVYGVAWILFVVLFSPSLDFAQGRQIVFPETWLVLLAGLLVVPLGFWDWKSRERKFLEREKTGPLPENGVL